MQSSLSYSLQNLKSSTMRPVIEGLNLVSEDGNHRNKTNSGSNSYSNNGRRTNSYTSYNRNQRPGNNYRRDNDGQNSTDSEIYSQRPPRKYNNNESRNKFHSRNNEASSLLDTIERSTSANPKYKKSFTDRFSDFDQN